MTGTVKISKSLIKTISKLNDIMTNLFKEFAEKLKFLFAHSKGTASNMDKELFLLFILVFAQPSSQLQKSGLQAVAV